MKKLLNGNNFVGATETEVGVFDLEFIVQGLRMFIRGAKVQGGGGIPFVEYLNYWNEKKNVERAIEQAEEVDIVEEVEDKNEVALTAKQLADLGDMLLTNKRMLEFQNHALALVKSPQEIDREDLIVHYHELYRLVDDMFDANQYIAKQLDMTGFLLLESTNKDEIDAHYNK